MFCSAENMFSRLAGALVVRLAALADAAAPGWNDLPEAFRDLVERSLRLQNRIALLDREIYRPASEEEFQPDNENSVQAQLNLLRTAFNAG